MTLNDLNNIQSQVFLKKLTIWWFQGANTSSTIKLLTIQNLTNKLPTRSYTCKNMRCPQSQHQLSVCNSTRFFTVSSLQFQKGVVYSQRGDVSRTGHKICSLQGPPGALRTGATLFPSIIVLNGFPWIKCYRLQTQRSQRPHSCFMSTMGDEVGHTQFLTDLNEIQVAHRLDTERTERNDGEEWVGKERLQQYYKWKFIQQQHNQTALTWKQKSNFICL